MGKKKTKSDRHLNPRLPVRVPQTYLDLLARVAKYRRWSKTTTVMVALEGLFAKHGLDPNGPPDQIVKE